MLAKPTTLWGIMNLASFKSNQNIFNANTLKFGLLSRTIVEKGAREQSFVVECSQSQCCWTLDNQLLNKGPYHMKDHDLEIVG
jgi:hypothetical protein